MVTTSGNTVLTLSGTNTYTGTTNINGGTLRIGADNNLGDAGGMLTFDGGHCSVYPDLPPTGPFS